jgi:hypothetical protein
MVTTDFDAPAPTASAGTGGRKLRLGALTALVIGSMVGSGVFSLPQNMAAGAGPLAILIGWAITAVGMLALVFIYQSLAVRKPQLDAGPYAYAKAGFGPFVGFNSAWGYWISAWVGRWQQCHRRRARRRHRLRPQRLHQHAAAPRRDRGDHGGQRRAQPRPRRRALHDLPAHPRRHLIFRSDHHADQPPRAQRADA